MGSNYNMLINNITSIIKNKSQFGYVIMYSVFNPFRNGVISDIATDSIISKKYKFDHEGRNDLFERVLDARGCCVLPGLIDAHTHPVWAGDRVHEFAMKLDGASYMDIHAVNLNSVYGILDICCSCQI